MQNIFLSLQKITADKKLHSNFRLDNEVNKSKPTLRGDTKVNDTKWNIKIFYYVFQKT